MRVVTRDAEGLGGQCCVKSTSGHLSRKVPASHGEGFFFLIPVGIYSAKSENLLGRQVVCGDCSRWGYFSVTDRFKNIGLESNSGLICTIFGFIIKPQTPL